MTVGKSETHITVLPRISKRSLTLDDNEGSQYIAQQSLPPFWE